MLILLYSSKSKPAKISTHALNELELESGLSILAVAVLIEIEGPKAPNLIGYVNNDIIGTITRQQNMTPQNQKASLMLHA